MILLQLFQIRGAHASYEKLDLFLFKRLLVLSEFLLDRDSRPHVVDDTTDSVGFLRAFACFTAGKKLLDSFHSSLHGRNVTGLAVPLIDGVEHQFLV